MWARALVASARNAGAGGAGGAGIASANPRNCRGEPALKISGAGGASGAIRLGASMTTLYGEAPT
jgi:hypothetical protein